MEMAAKISVLVSRMGLNRASRKLPSVHELLGLVQDGTAADAFDRLLERYMPVIRFNAGRYAGVFGADIEDLRQEAMITLFRAAKGFDVTAGNSFSAYATASINNAMAAIAKKSFKSSQGYSGINLDELDSSQLSLRVAGNTSVRPVEDQFLDREAKLDRESKIAALLSDFERRVLRLYLGGHSYQQISGVLRVSTKAVDNALQRVRRKLRSLAETGSGSEASSGRK